jgi:hypothetical protein
MNRHKRKQAHEFEADVTREIDTAHMDSGAECGALTFEQECRVQCERLRSLSPDVFRFAMTLLACATGSSDENDVDMDEIHFIR